MLLENRRADGTLISSYAYTLDAAGNRTKVAEEPSGRVVEYVYDATNRLEQETITEPGKEDRVTSYKYDKVGNRLTKTECTDARPCVSTTYQYDANNRMIREDDVIFRYDDNGNLIEKESAEEQILYAYDSGNHLIRAETSRYGATIVVEYEYDADGNRVRKTIDNTIVINYLVDTNRDYAQVVEERDQDGNLLVRYVYGHDLISQTRDNITSYYHYDGLGSTRELTSSAGIVTDTYTYDAFGLLLEQTGTTENAYRYRGEQFDDELGFYYLRARYMNPTIGRFVTMDEFAGSSQDPYSLHKYLYAHANPMTYSDPSGYFSLAETKVGIAIRGILSRSSTLTKILQYRKTVGAIGSAVVAMTDTWLGGGDWGDILISGVVGGATGAVAGVAGGYLTQFPRIVCTLKYLSPVAGALGLKLEIEGIKESLRKKEYDQALFRALVALGTVRAMAHAWNTRGCFTEDTLIQTKEGYTQIKNIEAGDEVYAEDVDTGERGFKRVKQVLVRRSQTLLHIWVDDIEIVATPEHPFWIPGEGWVPAGQLEVDDILSNSSGERVRIASITEEHLKAPITVYNFEVEEWHTYFVSKNNILVHNNYIRNKGERGELSAIASFKAKGGKIRHRSVSFKANGKRAVADAVGELNGDLYIIEAKNGTGAGFTRNQRVVYPELWTNGGVPVGQNAVKAGLKVGKKTKPFKFFLHWIDD